MSIQQNIVFVELAARAVRGPLLCCRAFAAAGSLGPVRCCSLPSARLGSALRASTRLGPPGLGLVSALRASTSPPRLRPGPFGPYLRRGGLDASAAVAAPASCASDRGLPAPTSGAPASDRGHPAPTSGGAASPEDNKKGWARPIPRPLALRRQGGKPPYGGKMTVSVEGKAGRGGNPPSAATCQPVSRRARRRASDIMGSCTIIHGGGGAVNG